LRQAVQKGKAATVNAAKSQRVPDAVQRASGAPLIRDRQELALNDPGSAAHHFARAPCCAAPGTHIDRSQSEDGLHSRRRGDCASSCR